MFAWMMALLLLSQSPTADASGWECEDCCRAAGLAGCPTRVRVYGDGSLAVKEGAVWRIKGLWWLDCDKGPSFDPGATVVVSEAPRAGEVLRLASPPATVRCFSQSCAPSLPHNACILEHQGDLFRLVRCDDQQPLTEREMRAPAAVTASTSATLASTTRTGEVAPLPPLSMKLTAPIALPAAPEGRCQTSALVAEEATRRLVMGDAARISGNLEEAVGEYLAAITMDRCSVNGWAALGAAALGGGRLQEAREALLVAVRLDGGHYGAQTALGEVEERLGQRQRAADAYRAALQARPDHAPAQRGLARLGAL